jgi:hypothetical protein
MASSQVQISNLALAHIGVSQFIAAPNEKSKEANICALFFEQVRDNLLESLEWNFASRRVKLAQTTSAITNWLYAYQVPTDCIAARRLVMPGMRMLPSESRIPFEIGSDGKQTVILTDQENAELIYTERVTDPNRFAPSFVTALSWYLAAEIAMPLAVSTQLADRAAKMAQAAFNSAAASDLQQEQEDNPPESEFIRARF